MALPYFFVETLNPDTSDLQLDEESSRHIIHVLRMTEGERLRLTDGKGNSADSVLVAANKKRAVVQIAHIESTARHSPLLTIAISLVKNTSRFEWFLEKATEFGTAEIVPLLCERTIKEKFRSDRMLGICKSAMLQSMQTWLPALHEPLPFADVIAKASQQQKMIAHCAGDLNPDFSSLYNPSLSSHIILIGPEGDFTENEITAAAEQHFISVSLGDTRLRTETAGIFAAAWASGARHRE